MTFNLCFVFECQGVPAVILGLMTLFILPSRPESTRFFTESERKLAMERMNRSSSGDVGTTINRCTYPILCPYFMWLQPANSAHIILAFRDWRVREASSLLTNATDVVIGLCRRDHLFRIELLLGLDLGLPTDDYYDFWIQ
jgi:hypothetical protein